MDAKPYLRSIELKRDEVEDFEAFPFCLPAIRGLESVPFHPDVTFFVGENGTGKSTIIEAIAAAMGLNPEGGNLNTRFVTEATHSQLHEVLKTIKSYKRPRDLYFLRAESFYNVATYMDQVAPPPLQGYGGKSLHQQSHGEAFMAVLSNKLRGGGLYFMDEPEAALSPTRQLAALAEIHRLVRAGSQFVIATHSPILLAYPRARILLITEDGLSEVAYTDTDHYLVTRSFLERHETMLGELLGNDD